ncbi:hypothetical protein [Pedobacter aquatilis]|uniref:hypothetical protein n=1 Tax=Pedobacter aquatilis TaxID=351343 RepID=UPI00292D3054|nr:hypothetical protein [Pedobacter aquatilis]
MVPLVKHKLMEMPIYYLPNGRLFAYYHEKPKLKFRPIISHLLIEKFGKGPFSTEVITETLFFAFDWYSQEFMKILNEQNEVSFYQALFGLHEFASKSHQENPNKSPIPQMDDQDFALYRRILKLCLEQACDIPLVRNIPFPTPEFLKSKELIIEDLMYLGDFLYEFSDLLAQQHMIEDCVDLLFTDKDLFYFTYKHHYGFIIQETLKEINSHLDEAIIGGNDFEDFKTALEHCHGMSYEQIISTIILMHERNEKQGGKMAMEEWYAYPKNLELLFDIPDNKAKDIFGGLTLTKENKMSLKDAIFKPYHINKYLYRPILVWNVKGVDRAIVGEFIFNEAIVSLYSNAFGWNKYPSEWDNECFKSYIKAKVVVNDKILEDAAELALNKQNVLYDRNITNLKKWNNQNINIHNDKCGEIDLLFVLNDKLYICDSKHLISRYDMNNFRNDYAAFETAKKAYNKTMRRKVAFLLENISHIQEHFQVLKNDRTLNVELKSVEGCFVVNTPTFVMYNNEYRIYTIKSFKEFLNGTFEDTTFQLLIDDEEKQTLLQVQYPYFRKPDYLVFNPEAED